MQQISFKSVQRFYQNSISMCHMSLNSWHRSLLSAKALYFPTHSMIMPSIKLITVLHCKATQQATRDSVLGEPQINFNYQLFFYVHPNLSTQAFLHFSQSNCKQQTPNKQPYAHQQDAIATVVHAWCGLFRVHAWCGLFRVQYQVATILQFQYIRCGPPEVGQEDDWSPHFLRTRAKELGWDAIFELSELLKPLLCTAVTYGQIKVYLLFFWALKLLAVESCVL